MNAYLVQYKGLWMGGKAVVLAGSSEQAVRLLECLPSALNFKNTTVKQIPWPEDADAIVLYNDNGDY